MLAQPLKFTVKSLFASLATRSMIVIFTVASSLLMLPAGAASVATKAEPQVKKVRTVKATLVKTKYLKPQRKALAHNKANKAKRSKSVVASSVSKRKLRQLAPREPIDGPTIGDMAGLKYAQDPLALASNVAFVVDQDSSTVLFEKNSDVSLPIASITKLMTSLVVVDTKQDLDEMIEIGSEDLDKEKGTTSRLQMGARLSRADLLHIALMSSENRAASALGRNYPGGLTAFVAAMNAKALQLGMLDTHYVDASGLSSKNVASARDLVKLINAAYQSPLIREYSTDTKYVVNPKGRRTLEYGTTNKLVSNAEWNIGLQKTGYIAEAGRCLVMQAMIGGRAVVMVFLDSKGKYSRLADAGRIKKWIQTLRPQA